VGAALTRRSCVAEVIGPPGVGKSTLVGALVRADPAIAVLDTLQPAGTATMVAGAGRAARLLPLARRARPRRKVARLLARAETARHAVAAGRLRAPVLLIDQGPVYTLARLEVAGVRWDGSLARWRARMLDDIAEMLDLTVWVTCPIDVALARIGQRPKSHAAETAGPDLVAMYQRAYASLRTDLVARRVPEVEVRTDVGTVEDASAILRGALGADR